MQDGAVSLRRAVENVARLLNDDHGRAAQRKAPCKSAADHSGTDNDHIEAPRPRFAVRIGHWDHPTADPTQLAPRAMPVFDDKGQQTWIELAGRGGVSGKCEGW